MKRLFSALAVLAVALLVAVPALAAAQKPADGGGRRQPPADAVVGRVVKVDGTNLIIKGRGADAKEVTIATDADTKVTLDGKEAKLADLKEGYFVLVTPKEGTAKEIKARSQAGRGGRGGRGGADKPAETPKE